MENQFNTPSEIINLSINSCENKTKLPLGKMILLGIMAGLFIAFGAATSSTAAHAVTNVGLARLVAGVIFPVGLMLIVFLGGELFTGNCLIILDVLDKRVTCLSLVRDLVIVYFTNLIGSLIVVFLIYYSGNLNYSDGLLGAYTIKVAACKIAMSPAQTITSGILCNILVCLAVLMATSAKDIAGKVWAIFFPICAFVVGGFEHCVANMYYIPAGILAAVNPAYVAKAQEIYGLTDAQISSLNLLSSLHSFLPVTLGNIIGGMLIVGVPLYLIYKKSWK
ncbi:MAG: formate/nitrite transporter family protein [Hespellia sp.]|nr:formate/nitrite transporter family protein [Hespellia sp.]